MSKIYYYIERSPEGNPKVKFFTSLASRADYVNKDRELGVPYDDSEGSLMVHSDDAGIWSSVFNPVYKSA